MNNSVPANDRLNYIRIFNPPLNPLEPTGKTSTPPGDRRDGMDYVFSEEIVLAVNVALATKRPLLITGPSGAGKSSLARAIAQTLGSKYYEVVVTSRSQANDLLWTLDPIRRLADAQAGVLKSDVAEYIQPGVLWWAFDSEDAGRRGGNLRSNGMPQDPALQDLATFNSVILIDEIDKADPDMPNGLLVPLGSLQFNIPELCHTVRAKTPPLIVITTNEERELSKPFLRRCVTLNLPSATREQLIQIASARFGTTNNALHVAIADLLLPKDNPTSSSSSPNISAAEYIDAINACTNLGITEPTSNHPAWTQVQKIVLTHNITPGNN
jgi:MoxR-like ATPase